MDDLEKAQDAIVEILCELETIFLPAFFTIIVHLTLHLPEKVLESGPVHMRWMYLFERYLRTLKNFVRNKAKPEGFIVEAYVAEEALAFVASYFKDSSNEVVQARELSVFQSEKCVPF